MTKNVAGMCAALKESSAYWALLNDASTSWAMVAAAARPFGQGSMLAVGRPTAQATLFRTRSAPRARSHGKLTTSRSSKPQYTARPRFSAACVIAASRSGAAPAGCGWSE